MKFELVPLNTADPSLGRVDHEQQRLIKMVIDRITNKEKICGDVDESAGIQEWKGIEIKDGEVVDIEWGGFRLRGSLHLQWLPSSVRKLSIFFNRFTGTVDLASLPNSMNCIYLAFNTFTGSIGLKRLQLG
ncbi:hypothetical protein XU18_3982 [Perkinsela sp. CCAP 1560/4]|nr:hypothetical protein XU18_4607 [Perkinsela sp. CCAP 1560/4]KNH04857.1 hypothetical protein XU18_3982 [Perkinsela sp. CCAP 1560/4]|eukprot:KNH04093.1 hypothetical protein XU18_4607 [Perkinsela sp. CCAP 1560/4]